MSNRDLEARIKHDAGTRRMVLHGDEYGNPPFFAPVSAEDCDFPITPGGGTFLNAAATTVTVGGITLGSTFPVAKTLQEMLDLMLYPYGAPTFSAFSISGVTSPLEVGASFGAAVTFTWSTTNSANVAVNTVAITDNGVGVASGLANDGTEAVTLGAPVTRTTAGTYPFGISATNTIAGAFSRALTITWQWRLYYGTSTNPTLSAAQILALSSSTLASGYAGSFSFAAGGYKYICLAHTLGGQLNTVKDSATLLSVPMATGTFTDGGGFGYEKVSVTNAQGVTSDVRVYRTFNVLGSAITLLVT